MRDGYGRTLKKRRTVPTQCRAYRQEKEEKMTEEERIRASNNFERRLQQMDAERLQKIDLRKIDWALVILLAMIAFSAFYFLRQLVMK